MQHSPPSAFQRASSCALSAAVRSANGNSHSHTDGGLDVKYILPRGCSRAAARSICISDGRCTLAGAAAAAASSAVSAAAAAARARAAAVAGSILVCASQGWMHASRSFVSSTCAAGMPTHTVHCRCYCNTAFDSTAKRCLKHRASESIACG